MDIALRSTNKDISLVSGFQNKMHGLKESKDEHISKARGLLYKSEKIKCLAIGKE